MEEIKKIKLMIKEPGKQAYVTEVDDTYEKMSEIVGGLIDCVEMPGVRDVDIYFNDEGKLDRLDGNIWLAGSDDCIVGTLYMVGYDSETGDNISLTDSQIKQCEKYVNTFSLPEGTNLYTDYYILAPFMNAKSERYFHKSTLEM